MNEPLAKLLKDVRLAAGGAPAESVQALPSLPADLAALLSERDGGSGTLGDRKRPVTLWSVEQIAREAETQEVSLAVPGLCLFGTDGGSEGYGYLPRLKSGRYGRISLLAAGAHEFESLGDTFLDFLQQVAAGR